MRHKKKAPKSIFIDTSKLVKVEKETKKKKKPSKEITLPKEPNSGGVIAVILLTFLFILINIFWTINRAIDFFGY